MAALGFNGFETFAAILEEWDKRGTLSELLASHKIPLVSARDDERHRSRDAEG